MDLAMLERSMMLKQSASQVSCKLDDEIAILSLEKAVYFGLEGVGARIWQALEQPRTVDDLCKLILDGFDVAPADCEADVMKFLGNMQDAGLVEIVKAPV